MSSSEANEPLQPLGEKELQILQSVNEDDVNSLKSLLDSPRWYKVTNRYKTPILHLAILHDSERIFDFLLSLPDYPLELVDADGTTALITALEEIIREYYVLELIKKGADIYHVSNSGKNLLHRAIKTNLLNTAEALVERGLDINQQDSKGNTPLHICCIKCHGVELVEGVGLLLYHGADPLIRNFENLTPLDLILRSTERSILTAKLNLFYYTFDPFTECDIDAEAFLRATELDSSTFYEITKYVRKVIFNCLFPSDFVTMLFSMETHCLQIIIDKFDYVIKELLRMSPQNIHRAVQSKQILIDNFFLLMKSKSKSQFARWLRCFNLKRIILNIFIYKNSRSSVEQFILFILSYGNRICQTVLEKIYHRFGYCELFKILLHMEMETENRITDVMVSIRYNVVLDMPEMIKQPHLLPPCFERDLKKILPYYTVPSCQPRVPLLVELARDAFRRYFIKRFDIKNARQFYSLIKLLPVSTYHLKIITLERKLYMS